MWYCSLGGSDDPDPKSTSQLPPGLPALALLLLPPLPVLSRPPALLEQAPVLLALGVRLAKRICHAALQLCDGVMVLGLLQADPGPSHTSFRPQACRTMPSVCQAFRKIRKLRKTPFLHRLHCPASSRPSSSWRIRPAGTKPLALELQTV